MSRYEGLMDYIRELEDIVEGLNQLIASLEGNELLESERDGLATARDHARAVLHSFKRLKGVAR